MKTELTKRLERALLYQFNDKYGRGKTLVLECPLGNWYKGLDLGTVDGICYNQTLKKFICFEIKISVSDFHSKAKKSFVGTHNYYVMPEELYEKIKSEIPNDIGVYIDRGVLGKIGYLACVKKCKPKILTEEDKVLLLSNMLRSARNRTNLERLKEVLTDENL